MILISKIDRIGVEQKCMKKIDGKSLVSQSELSQLGVLKLQECVMLENSYLRLRYEVIR